MSFDISNACELLLAQNADGAKSGLYVQKNYASAWSCEEDLSEDFSTMVEKCYRLENDEVKIAFVIENKDTLSCSDYSLDNVFCIFGLLIGFCIADDGCPALLLIV